MKLTIIGLGEAGPVFGCQLQTAGWSVTAWDIRQEDASTSDQQITKTRSLGFTPASSISHAVNSADLVISTVTAEQALVAAEQAASALPTGCQWLDLNSVSPSTKLSIHHVVSDKGALFTEGVAMDTIPSKGAHVPLLLCGPASQGLSQLLNSVGLNTRSISETLGVASTTKLLRSILIKGMEALFAESMEAAGSVGMPMEVIDSLQATYPGINWQQVAGYQLSRAAQHASRRASEMREAVKMLEQLNVNPIMTKAIAARQQNLSDRNLAASYQAGTQPTINDYINALRKSDPA